MIKVIENNYHPIYEDVEVSTTHHGYEVICDTCKSKLRLEKSDVKDGSGPYDKNYRCPCCGHNQYFGRYKKVHWLEVHTERRLVTDKQK